ncbi:MAG: copper amine oxidase N-terminal domain-containing protein [Clostridia bacterium]|nr:copper amine oxidase N-terminal domain-containing protein [Clostridia bacterium]
MRRSFIVLLITFMCGLLSQTQAFASSEDVNVMINGSYISSDVKPYIKNGSTLVPLRVISESLGAKVEWNAASNTVTINKDQNEIEIEIGANQYVKNGITYDFPGESAEIKDNRTMVPLRAVATCLGMDVSWNNDLRVAFINSNRFENKPVFMISGLINDSFSIGTVSKAALTCHISEDFINGFDGEYRMVFSCDDNYVHANWEDFVDDDGGKTRIDLSFISGSYPGRDKIRVWLEDCNTNEQLGNTATFYVNVVEKSDSQIINNELNGEAIFAVDDTIEISQYQSLTKPLLKDSSVSGNAYVEVADKSLVSASIVNDKNLTILGNTKVGTTTVTLKYYPDNGNEVVKTVSVKVKKWEPSYFKSFTSEKVAVGGSQAIYVGSGYLGKTGQTCVATSSNESIATVVKDLTKSDYSDRFNFNVYGHKDGKVDITFTFYVNNLRVGSSSYTFTVGTGKSESVIKISPSVPSKLPSSSSKTTDTISLPSYTIPSYGGYGGSNTSMGSEPLTYSTGNKVSFFGARYPLYLYSEDGEHFLGKITSNKYDSKSIFNSYGSYGSAYGRYSIWNEYGKYGGKYGAESAFSEYTRKPPVILDSNGRFVGYLTANEYKRDGYSIKEVSYYLGKYE